jgi:hypothetical protein
MYPVKPGFELEYSLIYSFYIALIISIYPYGVRLYMKIYNGAYPEETLFQACGHFFTTLTLFTFFILTRLWMNDCHYSCILIYDHSFGKCCAAGGWDLY